MTLDNLYDETSTFLYLNSAKNVKQTKDSSEMLFVNIYFQYQNNPLYTVKITFDSGMRFERNHHYNTLQPAE